MAPAPPLPVTEDTPPDMLAGSMDLRVFLPNGQSVKMSVDRSTPMMDLLVQVTTLNKISPGGHVLQAVGERGILPYKPSTPIGALDTWTIHVVPKGKPFGTSGPAVTPKKAPLKPLNQQPFEQTFRLQVHLPRNQLYVTRVSPKTRLSDILLQTCAEKNLDSSKYEIRHPANLSEVLNLSCTLADYKLQEVTVVSKSSLGSALSSSDIMALQREEEKRRQQARQQHGPGTGLGLVFNKRNQSSACEGSVSSDSLGGRSISPARSDESASRSASPPAPVIPPMMAPPTRPARKRRPAPKPPSTPAKQIEGVRGTTAESSDAPVVNGNVPKGKGIPVSHSRNSSDSSGYHEASVLSESPAEGNQMPENCSDSLQRQSKLPPLRAKSQGEMCLSSSMSSLSGSNSQENTVATCQLSTSNSSLASSTGLGLRKKKAPPPPPGAAKTTSLERNKSVSLDPEPDRRSTFPGKLKSAASLERSSSTESESSLQGQPKLEHYPSTETEELDTLPEDGSENIECAAIYNQETVPDPKLPDVVSDPPVESSRRPPSPPVEAPTSVTASALPSGVPRSSPAPGTEVDDAVNQVDAAFQSVTELEAVIRKEEEQEQLNDLPPPLSPTASELEEWEYQLPAPPSAFRDAAGSPTPTDAGETVVLADAQVFQESAAETAPVCEATKEQPWNKNEAKHKNSSVNELDSAQPLAVETVAIKQVTEKGKRQKTTKTQKNSCDFSAGLSSTVEKNNQEPKKNTENLMKNVPLEESLNRKTESAPVKNKRMEEQEVSYVANDILKTEQQQQPEIIRNRTLLPSMGRDVSQPFKPNITALERKPVSVQKVVEKQTQVRQPTEPEETNHLSNFTITTYQRPHDSAYDILAEEENNRWSSRKLGGSTSLTYLNSASSKVSRANSFNANDESISLASPVKRSTSYISLEENPAPEIQLLSGGSGASSYVSRTKSTGNLAVAEEEHWQGSTLRKAASNLDIGNEQRIMQQFLQLQEQLQASAPSDVPLQSLQVLRSILPQLTQAAAGIPSSKTNFQRSISNENSQIVNGTASEPARQSTMVTLSHTEKTAPTATASNSSNNRNVSSDNRPNVGYRNKETFVPSYQSNEKTGYKSSSIEKRNSWNISQENSNNSGSENIRLTENSAESNDNLNKENFNGNNEKLNEDKMNVTKRYSYQGPPAINFTTWSERPKSQVSIKLDRDYRIGGRGAPDVKQEERNEQPEPAPPKTEPVQLTMRLVSHTTTAPATYKSSSVSINGHKDPVGTQQQQQVRLGTSDPSRVPIVRAVELKKSFVQRTLGWNSVNGETTEPTPTKDNTHKPEVKQNGQEDEIFIGVNSLARKFGPPASFRAPRPLSMYGKIERTEEVENGMGQRSTSTSNLLQQQQQQKTQQRNPRRYTSVVGINNSENEEHRVLSSSSSFREPQHLKHSSSIVRVNGITAPKQLMPVVKGFQFAAPAANRENPPAVRPQISVTKVQRSESASGNCWKSNQNNRQNIKPVELQNGNALESTPPPPPPPFAMTLKKVSDRPRQPPLPAGNPRDLLMDAIRNFGGRDKLRQVRETQSSLNVVLIR